MIPLYITDRLQPITGKVGKLVVKIVNFFPKWVW